MMPLIKTNALCKQTQLIVEQSKRELSRLREMHYRAEDYIASAKAYLKTANLPPAAEASHAAACEEAKHGQANAFPIVRSGDAGWNKRAQEVRFLAEKIKDAGTKKEMMEIAEHYERLGAGTGSNQTPASQTSLKPDAIAA